LRLSGKEAATIRRAADQQYASGRGSWRLLAAPGGFPAAAWRRQRKRTSRPGGGPRVPSARDVRGGWQRTKPPRALTARRASWRFGAGLCGGRGGEGGKLVGGTGRRREARREAFRGLFRGLCRGFPVGRRVCLVCLASCVSERRRLRVFECLVVCESRKVGERPVHRSSCGRRESGYGGRRGAGGVAAQRRRRGSGERSKARGVCGELICAWPPLGTIWWRDLGELALCACQPASQPDSQPARQPAHATQKRQRGRDRAKPGDGHAKVEEAAR